MESNPKPELVVVIWEDTAALEETWSDEEEARELKPGIMHSVGWILAKTPKYLTITSSVEFDGELVGDVNCIPLGCIREIKQIRPHEEST